MQVEGSSAAFAEGIETGALGSGLIVRSHRFGQPMLGSQIGLPRRNDDLAEVFAPMQWKCPSRARSLDLSRRRNPIKSSDR